MACKYRVAGLAPYFRNSLLPRLSLETFETVSGEQFLHDGAVNVGQAEIAPLKAVGQFGVIEAQQVEERRMQIMDVDPVFHDIEAQLIGFTQRDSGLDAAPCHPHGEGVG